MKHLISKKVLEQVSIMAKSPRKTKLLPEGFVTGLIDRISERDVQGWMYSPVDDVTPILFVDGEPALLVEWPTPRSDVNEALGITGGTGFRFRVPSMKLGAPIELYALVGEASYLVLEQRAEVSIAESRPLIQMKNAREIAEKPNAVAVVCWDAAHNPLGRAKVLYDVVGTRRPVTLFAYIFNEFGKDIWAPLLDSDVSVVTIPWKSRETYHRLIQQLGLKYKTVWLCKPRLPTFLLGAQVADADAGVILDIDDNEECFARADAAESKIYGLAGLGLSKILTNKVVARTVASCTLQREFGGHMVRHARARHARADSRRSKDGTLSVGFVGTVRPHKNILSAAKAIRVLSWTTKKDIRFHVYGDIQPPLLREELLAHGVVVNDLISTRKLGAVLQTMDVVLTGFPLPNGEDNEITRFQITSKIGDALSVGKPVLVPEGPSVSDLADTPGIFLFNRINFGTKLTQALEYQNQIALPKEFTVDGACKGFEMAENEARSAPKAGEIFRYLNDGCQVSVDTKPRPTLLLIWKQHDAGMYGRRVDQIARSYKRAHPEHDVLVLELLHSTMEASYRDRSNDATSEAWHILRNSDLKESVGIRDADGVEYNLIKFSSNDELSELMLDFLSKKSLFHSNTIILLFPFTQYLDCIYDVTCQYKTIVDLVDNNFSWNPSYLRKTIAVQYIHLSRFADHIVFNSSENKEFFANSGFIPARSTAVSIIPNWYELPTGDSLTFDYPLWDESFNVIYSGNMNDRIDWRLLETVSDLSDRICIQLIGAAERTPKDFRDLLKRPNVIYHGVQQESAVLRILSQADLAIVPHLADRISNFMNPIKLQMYKAVDVPTVAMNVSGIEPTAMLDICESHSSFLDAVSRQLRSWEERSGERSRALSLPKERPQYAQSYIELIQDIRNG